MRGRADSGEVATLCALAFGPILLSCGASAPGPARTLDLDPPRLLEVVLEGGPLEASPHGTVRLRFDEPMAPQRVVEDAVVLVPFELGAACTVDLACGAGRCFRGRCQTDVVEHDWLQDLSRPPLTVSRQRLTVRLDAELQQSGAVLQLAARALLDTDRLHRLMFSSWLADLAGNPLDLDSAPGGGAGVVFSTGGAELAGAEIELVSPRDGTTDLPLNLSRVIAQSSRRLRGIATSSGLVLRHADGTSVALAVTEHRTACGPEVGAGRCFVGEPARPLGALVEWTLYASPDVTDERQRHVWRREIGRIATGSERDTAAPGLLKRSATVVDGCVLLEVQSDEPSDLELARDDRRGEVISVGKLFHQVAWRAPPAGEYLARIRLFDLAGNGGPVVSLRFAVSSAPQVSITEVLADPKGPEPQQEFVELVNRSQQPVNLLGWQLDDNDDGRGGVSLPAIDLQPGHYAVIVGPGYDQTSTVDPAPASGAALIRLDVPIGERGLANRGEPLVLRDPAGRLVSRYPGSESIGQAVSNGQSVERVPPQACGRNDDWRPHPDASASPGAPPGPSE
jgi:hypothetical protein